MGLGSLLWQFLVTKIRWVHPKHKHLPVKTQPPNVFIIIGERGDIGEE